MTTCPNCGHKISETDDICPNCGFNLKKYRDDFFTDQHQKAKFEEPDEGEKIISRAAYREEFIPEKQNTTVQRMIAWVRKNATLVFLLGVLLLILMSLQYTVDKRLTQKIDRIGSDVFNRVDARESKVKAKNREFVQKYPRVENHVREIKNVRKHHFNYVQISVIFTALVSLIVLFTDSGASAYTQRMSISNVLFGLAGRLLSSGVTSWYALILYIVWLLLFLFPIFIIYNILKNTKASQTLAFFLSLIESIFLIYMIFQISSAAHASTGVLAQLTSQLMSYAVSLGASAYFMILASVLTTILAGYNLFKKK